MNTSLNFSNCYRDYEQTMIDLQSTDDRDDKTLPFILRGLNDLLKIDFKAFRIL